MVAACPYPVPQGSQVLLRDTALAVRHRGHHVHLVVYGYGLGKDDSGLSVMRCSNLLGARKTSAGPSVLKPLLDLAMVTAVRRAVREHNVDVLHVHNYEALLVAFAARKRPIVYHAHNAMCDELPYYFGGSHLAARFGRWLDRNLPHRADHVIAPHQRLADYLIECGCRASNVAVLAPPADPDLFEECEVADGAAPVLYTGNLDAYQNLTFLTRVMHQVRKSRPGVPLLIATAEDTVFPGAETVRVHDFGSLRGILAKDSVVACPRVSWSGYPIKLLNAMAAGKAVVACEGGAHPLAHEQSGLVVPDNDVAAFADSLLRLMTDSELRRRLGRNAREAIVQNHDPVKFAARLEEIYAGLT